MVVLFEMLTKYLGLQVYPHPHCPHHTLSCKNPYKVVCHGDTRVAPSKDGEDPYAEPKARGIFIKVEIVDQYESGFHLGRGWKILIGSPILTSKTSTAQIQVLYIFCDFFLKN